METPNFSHITAEDYDHIYEPSEDSFLLLDAIEKDMNHIVAQKPLFCVELGVGSGVIITALSRLLKASTHCLGIDISPYACGVAQKTAAVNGAALDIVNMNLLSGIRDHSIDLLLFNPPYVPSRLDEENFKTTTELESHDMIVSSSSIVGTWAGGVDGREVIDRVLSDLDRVLAPGAVFYLLLLKENKPQEIMNRLRKEGLTAEIHMERRIIGEHLFVVKIVKGDETSFQNKFE